MDNLEHQIAQWIQIAKGDVAGHPFHGNQWETVGGITPEVASFLASNTDKFYKAGGTTKTYGVEPSGKRSNETEVPPAAQSRIEQMQVKISEQLKSAAPEEQDSLRRLAMGYERMTSALNDIIHGDPGIIAYDKDGNIVSAMSIYSRTLTAPYKYVKVNELGSTNELPGSATALEIEAARFAAEKSMPLRSQYTGNSMGYHSLLGRTLDGIHQGSSEWTAKECASIATLSPPHN